MSVRFVALETPVVRALQAGDPDANGQKPERHTSPGTGVPCRHCLKLVAAGEPFLILAYRPFPAAQPYAEQGPIFLHAQPCLRHKPGCEVPPILASDRYIMRGYDNCHRIVYGSGQIAVTAEIPSAADAMFKDSRISYIHVRSASNNCFQCRIERA